MAACEAPGCLPASCCIARGGEGQRPATTSEWGDTGHQCCDVVPATCRAPSGFWREWQSGPLVLSPVSDIGFPVQYRQPVETRTLLPASEQMRFVCNSSALLNEHRAPAHLGLRASMDWTTALRLPMSRASCAGSGTGAFLPDAWS